MGAETGQEGPRRARDAEEQQAVAGVSEGGGLRTHSAAGPDAIGFLSDHVVSQTSPLTPADRQRDILPLPEGTLPFFRSDSLRPGLSRSARMRGQHSLHVKGITEDIIYFLNAVYVGPVKRPCLHADPTAGQADSIDRLRRAVAGMGPPPDDFDGPGALRALRSKQGYFGESATLAPLSFENLDKVSLPPIGDAHVSFECIGGLAGRKLTERLLHKLFPNDQAREKQMRTTPSRAYSDPSLAKNPKLYAAILKKLDGCGLIEWGRTCRLCVGLFFVVKKDGRLRVILDGRIPSSWFEEPDSVRLASGQAFASLEVDSRSPVFLGGVDTKDAFYRVELPSDLRDLFGLPSIRACHVGVQSILGVSVHPNDMIVPCFKGVPMGWNRSLWICQSLHEVVAGRVQSVTEASRFVDRKAAPVLQPFGHTEYVDNFIALGQSRARACSHTACRA